VNRLSYRQLLAREFSGYGAGTFRQDLLAGLTVAAVALPLALAFGVASGATAAAGLVTAVVAGLVIGILSGAPYQISGPTGAMSAVLIVITQRYGLEAAWVMGVMAGILILIVGLLRLGRFVAFIPAPVIAGFTSGIAVIIFVGQIDNFLGIQTPAAESTLTKLLGYFQGIPAPSWPTVLVGTIVVAIMLFWPARLNRILPASLLGIIVATVVSLFLPGVARIGEIPRTILLSERLMPGAIPWDQISNLIVPALSIAALGTIESLLCGAVGSKMTGVRLQANQELIGQGIGNILIPFFGGIPATAAIARTSVAIKSGAQTRLTSIIHALVLMLSALLLAPVISQIPLAALAGVLMVTAVRMSEWHSIYYIFARRFKTAMITFIITLLATITFDLTQAILIGVALSAIVFINQVANINITVSNVDPDKLRERGMDIKGDCPHVRVAYLTGPLFFAATNNFNEAFARLDDTHVLVLSMRAVPLIDVSGLEVLTALHDRMAADGRILLLSGLQPDVQRQMERGGLLETIGAENVFWSADLAIQAAEQRFPCPICAENNALASGPGTSPNGKARAA
jgi:SulP family sulfate permease